MFLSKLGYSELVQRLFDTYCYRFTRWWLKILVDAKSSVKSMRARGSVVKVCQVHKKQCKHVEAGYLRNVIPAKYLQERGQECTT